MGRTGIAGRSAALTDEEREQQLCLHPTVRAAIDFDHMVSTAAADELGVPPGSLRSTKHTDFDVGSMLRLVDKSLFSRYSLVHWYSIRPHSRSKTALH